MTTLNADLCIIGAGSAGLSIAAGASQLGRNVVLIEKGEMGGDCLNTGCVPSKALIAAAARAQEMRDADKFGIKSVEPEIDFSAVMEHVAGVIATIAPMDSQERFEGLGVTVLRDHASFTGPRSVRAGSTTVNAKHFVISTGSSAFVPPIEGLDEVQYFTNETIFENRTRPDHLIVIGGGPIGIEMAQAHQRLGVKVTVIEGVRILGNDDPELVEIVRKELEADGINIIEGAMVSEIVSTLDGIQVVAGDHKIDGSHLLVAIGRKPNVSDLNLETAGVEFDNRGIKVDDRLRTSNKRIYAAGDVIGGRQFTHVAGYHASVIIRNILFKAPSKNHDDLAPWATYCDPELAHVGLTEADAREKHGNVKVAKWDFEENDRATAERDRRGMVKLVTKSNGTIIGASIVGKEAGDLIQPFVLAISNGLKVGAFTKYIAPYPTRGEALKRTGGAWYTPSLFSAKTRRLVSLLSTFD